MPLLANKVYILNKIKKDKKDDDGLLYHPLTGEVCENVAELARKTYLYNQKIWTCKITGQINLTFKEAQKSEQGCTKILKNAFMKCFEPVVLQYVHHSRENLENIIHRSWTQIHEEFCVNEAVMIKLTTPKKLLLKGVVVKVDRTPPIQNGDADSKINSDTSFNDKENFKRKIIPTKKNFHYSVKLFEMDKLVNDIPSETIERTLRPPSKDQIRMFIRAHAVRHSGKAVNPWIVDEELVKRYKLPNIEPGFICDKMMIKKLSHSAEMQIYSKMTEEMPKKSVDVMVDASKSSANVTVDLTLSDDDDEEEEKEKALRRKAVEEVKIPQKKSGKIKSPFSSPSRSLPPMAQQLLRLMKDNSLDPMVNQLLTRCCQYTDMQIDKFPDLIRVPIKDRKEKLELRRRLNAMSQPERDAYMAERRQELRDKRRLEGRVDDADMAHEVVLASGDLLTMPHKDMTHDQWARLVSLAEFVHCFRGFLTPVVDLTSEDVCRATIGGEDKDRSMFAEIVCVLLRPLLRNIASAGAGIQEDKEQRERRRVFGVSVNEIPVTVCTVAELLNQVLPSNEITTELDALSLDEKIALLEELQARVLELEPISEFIEECQREATEAYKKRLTDLKDLNDRWKEVRATLGDMFKVAPNVPVNVTIDLIEEEEMAPSAKRRLSLDMKSKEAEEREKRVELERQYRSREKDEASIKKQIEQAQETYVTAVNDAKSLMRVHPLGTDRHYRRYWHFKTAPAHIFVETDIANSDESPFVTEWRVFSSVEQVQHLLASLDEHGAREAALRKELHGVVPVVSEHMNKLIKEACINLVEEKEEDADQANGNGETDSYLMRGFKDELRETEINIRQGSLGGVNDMGEWEARLAQATTMAQMKEALVTVFNGVHHRFWTPLMKSVESQSEYLASVASAITQSRLNVLASLLDVFVCWSKSASDDKCRVCHKNQEEESLLLCDGCNRAYHTFCLRPSLASVPIGEWQCPSCITIYEEDGNDDEDGDEVEEDKCCVCAMSGDQSPLGKCISCHSLYHTHCHEPILRCVPKNGWHCQTCRKKKETSEEEKKNKKIARVSSTKTEEDAKTKNKKNNNKKKRAESSDEEQQKSRKNNKTKLTKKAKIEEISDEEKKDKIDESSDETNSKTRKIGRTSYTRRVTEKEKKKKNEESSEEEEEEDKSNKNNKKSGNRKIERMVSTRQRVVEEAAVIGGRKRRSVVVDSSEKRQKRQKTMNGDTTNNNYMGDILTKMSEYKNVESTMIIMSEIRVLRERYEEQDNYNDDTIDGLRQFLTDMAHMFTSIDHNNDVENDVRQLASDLEHFFIDLYDKCDLSLDYVRKQKKAAMRPSRK